MNFEVLCKRHVRSQERDVMSLETETRPRRLKKRLETETFENETTTLDTAIKHPVPDQVKP